MISAIIITLNEESKIRNALEGIKGLADEIVVVDSGSSDKTVEIARNLGAKVYIRKFDNFANQKNFALSKASGEWILALDADEEIPQELAQEIKEAVKNGIYNGYLMPRRNFILGKEIKYSRWSPDKHIWLWKKNSGKWVGDVHEEVLVVGKVGELKNSKMHRSHKTIGSFMQANALYSTLEAKSLFKKGVRFSLWKMLWQTVFEFFLRFVYKLGLLDGKQSFALCYLMGVYKLTVYIKLWELQKNQK